MSENYTENEKRTKIVIYVVVNNITSLIIIIIIIMMGKKYNEAYYSLDTTC